MKNMLCRAKRTDWRDYPKNMAWVQGYVLKDAVTGKVYIHLEGNELNESDKVHEEGFLSFVAVEIEEETLSSFTGKTIGEKRLFENDILFDEEECDFALVRWDENKGSYVLDFYGITGSLMEYGWDETAGEFNNYDTSTFSDYTALSCFKIIGNVFDNKEYLEGKYHEH